MSLCSSVGSYQRSPTEYSFFNRNLSSRDEQLGQMDTATFLLYFHIINTFREQVPCVGMRSITTLHFGKFIDYSLIDSCYMTIKSKGPHVQGERCDVIRFLPSLSSDFVTDIA